MTAASVIAALCLPADARVDQRVPKKLLVENGAPTAADKRQINDGIEELHWLAALKPATIGVPIFRDDTREYLEIAVLSATLRAGAKTTRICELIHRAIPYPALLLTTLAETVTVSVAHKRWSQGEAGRVVLDDAASIAVLAGTEEEVAFLAALPFPALPRADLRALYQGWHDAILALSAARLTGTFHLAETPAATTSRRAALAEHERLTREIASLRARAGKETQLNRRVELNLQLQQLESSLTQQIKRLA